MWTTTKKLFRDCLTESNGSYDVTRVITLGIAGTGWPVFLGCTIYSVYANPEHHFDMMNFGTAMLAILTGTCAAAVGIAYKQRTDTPPN
jgi:hypothetical protein